MYAAIDLESYRQIMFFICAGMPAESGIPTYRGAGGIWEQYRWQDCACQRAFDRAPETVLDFHLRRRETALACAPHAGHRHLALLQERQGNVTVVTQNIDGLLQRAGVSVSAELHGSLWQLRCVCGARKDMQAARLTARAGA